MNQSILKHFKQFGQFTFPGCFEDYVKKLPDEIPELAKLIRAQCIHRQTLQNGNTGTNADLRYGDMTKVPWYRQCEDDNFVTAAAMLAELFRRDERGIVIDREVQNKLILTCRFVAILTASILKAKGIPARVRSGFADYFDIPGYAKKSWDHWITQYWNTQKNRWVTIDIDGLLEDYIPFDRLDMPSDRFDFASKAWIAVRSGKIPADYFANAGGFEGLKPISWALFYDFHSLMNQEIIYFHTAEYVINFDTLKKENFQKLDHLAELLEDPDKNFDKLCNLWETDKQFRRLKGGLL